MATHIKGYIFLLFVVAAHCSVIDWDERLSARIREDLQSPALDNTMEVVTVLGSKEFLVAANLAVFTFGDDDKSKMARHATLSLASASLVTYSLKAIVNRPRPLHETDRWDSSFPSGHAAGAFATAVSYGLENRKLLIPLTAGATTIAFSRVYLGEHYVLDVVTGAIIGTVSAIVIHYLREEIDRVFPLF